MYCGKCGSKVEDKAKFCPKCGNKLIEKMNQHEAKIKGPSLWDMIAIPFIWILHKILEMFKRPESKTVIKVCASALAVVLLVVLIGNIAGGYNKKVLGEWYEEGSSMQEFALYDDGSCKVGNSLQKGEWSIVNKDQLHISTPWGQNRIFTIISVGGGKLVLAQHYAGGPGTMDAVTYWHTPHK